MTDPAVLHSDLDGWEEPRLPTVDGGCVTTLGVICSAVLADHMRTPPFRVVCRSCRPAVAFVDRRDFDRHDHLVMYRCHHCFQWFPSRAEIWRHRRSLGLPQLPRGRPRMRRTA